MHKILLVEDDATMLSLLQTLLQMEGFEVIKAGGESLEDILKFMKIEEPALALIDVHLRNASGFDLLTQIQQDPSLQNVRIIMSSGMDFTSRCKEAGADNFILKPYMPDELIKLIRQTVSS